MPSVYAHVLDMKLRTQPSRQIHTQRYMPSLHAMYTHVESEDSNPVLRFLYNGMFNSNAYCRFSHFQLIQLTNIIRLT